MAKRYLRIDGTDYEISKATAIKSASVPFLIHVDQLPDGTYRLTYNATKIPDFTTVSSIEVIREDDN